MKKISIALLALAALMLNSCDKITGPFIQDNGGTSNEGTGKIVLLEEYTGVRCQNCPAAAAEAHRLKENYGNQLVVIAIHPSGLSLCRPYGETDDYRTDAGREWYDFFGIPGLPKGMINRQSISEDGEWDGMVSASLAEEQTIEIELTPSYNATNREMNVAVKSTFLSALEGDYFLTVCLTEDSLVSRQANDNPTSIEEYDHSHVLRAVLNTAWGEQIALGNAAANAISNKTYNYTLPDSYRADKCHVIAFVYRDSDKVVMQAQSKSVL